jgi:hypothetical protein
MYDGKNQKHRAEQHFVGNRIKILPEQSLLMKSPREKTVKAIA